MSVRCACRSLPVSSLRAALVLPLAFLLMTTGARAQGQGGDANGQAAKRLRIAAVRGGAPAAGATFWVGYYDESASKRVVTSVTTGADGSAECAVPGTGQGASAVMVVALSESAVQAAPIAYRIPPEDFLPQLKLKGGQPQLAFTADLDAGTLTTQDGPLELMALPKDGAQRAASGDVALKGSKFKLR